MPVVFAEHAVRRRVIRVAYFGLPLGALALALGGIEPELVVLSPTAAPGRRRVKRRLRARVIDARGVDAGTLEADLSRIFEQTRFDLVLSWYWTRLLPARFLDRARFGGIGAHPSLLPRHRGPDPFFWAIDSGDTTTGVTIHRLEPSYDTGAILACRSVPVGERDAWELARALDRPSLRLFAETVRRVASGESIPGEEQDERAATEAPKPEGALLHVDFGWSTERVLRRIRALSPVPGLALSLRGVDLFVTRAAGAADFPAALLPGEAAILAEHVVIRTGDGAIAIARASVGDGDGDGYRELGGTELARFLAAPAGDAV